MSRGKTVSSLAGIGVLMVFACTGLFTVVLTQNPHVDVSVPPTTVQPSHQTVKGAPSSPVDELSEGIWEITKGSAGTYRVAQPLDANSTCYWQVSTDGAGGNIVSNDVVTGGTPEVKLKAGQWFKSTGCGVWKRR